MFGTLLVHGLCLEGAAWPTGLPPSALTSYLGGVEGLSGGGWLEPRPGSNVSRAAAAAAAAAAKSEEPRPVTPGSPGGGLRGGQSGGGGGESWRPRRFVPMPVALLRVTLKVEAEEEVVDPTELDHGWRVDIEPSPPFLPPAAARARDDQYKAKVLAASLAGEEPPPPPRKAPEYTEASRTSVTLPLFAAPDRSLKLCEVTLPAFADHNWDFTSPALFLHGE